MEGEEPPPEYKEIWELHRRMKTSQDYAERDRLWAEIKNKLSENLFWIIVELPSSATSSATPQRTITTWS